MIVKNESKIILRLLESVYKLIDYYCICDTGSTDDTIDVILSFFHSKNIPGKIFSEPFKNFEYNRNIALDECLIIPSDFILLLDADMIIDFRIFDKNILLKDNIDIFTILQGTDDFYYENARIIKNNGNFKYKGVTHEYLSSTQDSKYGFITKDTLFIRDFGDGGSKNDKFERDIQLLLKGIEDEPYNERYVFYLANSYYDIGQFETAIKYYNKRIEFGKWEQEVWYSYYRIGLCYKNLNNIQQAIYIWMEGYNYYPDRIENLYEIIKHYRIIGHHKLAFVYYKLALSSLNLITKDKDKDKNKFLFLHNDVYTYQIYYELTIIALYIGIHCINDEVIHILNNCNNLSIINNLLSNMKFYKDVLIPIKSITNLNSSKELIFERKNIRESFIQELLV
jgi:tetratricopeptide (TPR) repeat protein